MPISSSSIEIWKSRVLETDRVGITGVRQVIVPWVYRYLYNEFKMPSYGESISTSGYSVASTSTSFSSSASVSASNSLSTSNSISLYSSVSSALSCSDSGSGSTSTLTVTSTSRSGSTSQSSSTAAWSSSTAYTYSLSTFLSISTSVSYSASCIMSSSVGNFSSVSGSISRSSSYSTSIAYSTSTSTSIINKIQQYLISSSISTTDLGMLGTFWPDLPYLPCTKLKLEAFGDASTTGGPRNALITASYEHKWTGERKVSSSSVSSISSSSVSSSSSTGWSIPIDAKINYTNTLLTLGQGKYKYSARNNTGAIEKELKSGDVSDTIRVPVAVISLTFDVFKVLDFDRMNGYIGTINSNPITLLLPGSGLTNKGNTLITTVMEIETLLLDGVDVSTVYSVPLSKFGYKITYKFLHRKSRNPGDIKDNGWNYMFVIDQEPPNNINGYVPIFYRDKNNTVRRPYTSNNWLILPGINSPIK